MSTIKDILQKTKEQGFQEGLSSEVWLTFLLGEERLFLIKNPHYDLSTKVEQQYWEGIGKMTQGRPLAQLMGSKEFYGLSFKVNENVLIPRPESELLVEMAKDYISEHLAGREVRVADIGTGSGAILLAILSAVPQAIGVGVDVSARALEVARENADRLQLSARTEWIEGDLLEPIKKSVQVIVANLPYIGRERFNFVAENVSKYEPEVALYGGSDGLDLYRRMFQQLREKTWFPDLMIGEFGFGQQELMEGLLAEYFSDKKARIIDDLAGIPRVFVIGS